MNVTKRKSNAGFSLLELIMSMLIMLVLMGVVATLMSRSFAVRARESRKTDALAASQAALNVLSREIGNSGYGIYEDAASGTPNNGLIVADSDEHRLHFRANLTNTGPAATRDIVLSTSDPGEDVTYFFDAATDSIVRYDPHDTPTTSVVVNGISNVTFGYVDYNSSGVPSAMTTTPTNNTGRIRITVEVKLEPIVGQTNNQTVTFTSEVTLRNSNYMLRQY